MQTETQSEMLAARSCRIQRHRSIGPLRLRCYNPTIQGKRRLLYRVNDDSQAQNDSNTSTLVLLLAVGWFISLWSLGECVHFRGPLPNPCGWLTEPQKFSRTPVKNHWFNAWDRSTTAAAYELCCNDLLIILVGPLMRIGAYWCVVNSVFTHCGPQYAKVRFSRAPIRRIGALPHTLTTGLFLSVCLPVWPPEENYFSAAVCANVLSLKPARGGASRFRLTAEITSRIVRQKRTIDYS